MATGAVASSSGDISMHQPRVLSSSTNHHKSTISGGSQRKNEIKAMIASVQNAPVLNVPTGTSSPLSPLSDTGSTSKASPSAKMLAAHVKDETLLKVKIKSTEESGKFYVPVSLLVDRELEMRKSAKDFNIRATRWSKSRLFREWRNQLEQDFENNESSPRTEILIQLNPEEDCVSTNQSHSFQWHPWLTTCIRAYYNTGTIRIPDECVGSDILLALEYFGILYSPDQLVFDSFGGYLRVKMWSDYFTHRAKMADWVVQKLVTTPSRHSHCFVTSPNMEGDLFFLNSNKTMQVLDGELAVDQARYGDTPSRAVVHEFFNDEEEGNDSENANQKMDGLMRKDFCAFVQASLPGTNVTFAKKQVTNSAKETVERAVLRINLVPKPTSEGAAVRNPLAYVDKDVSIQETETTVPLTVSTQGADKTSLARAIVMRRSKTEEKKVVLETSFEDRPHDEYTPTSSPVKQSLNTPNNWADEASVDQPRETLNDASDFVRSLSQKIIRQTLADIDTIDHGLPAGSKASGSKTSGPTLRPSSATPFDERSQQQRQQHLTEDDIAKCMLPSLPSMELDKDYDRPTLTELPFQARHPNQEKFGTPKLEVIGQITTPNTTPKAISPPAVDKPAPVALVDVDHVNKPCDGSVMSALSSPFDDSPKHHPCNSNTPLDVMDAHRPQISTIEIHSGFRTPVDALSLTDDRSVRIEGQVDDVIEVVEGGDDDEEEERSPGSKRRSKSPRKEYVIEPDDMSQVGCVSSFLSAVCNATMAERGNVQKRRKKRPSKQQRRRKEHADDDTPNTMSETDEEDESPSRRRKHQARSRRSKPSSVSDDDRMSSQEMIAEIGDMADKMVEGIANSFNSMFNSEGGAREPKRKSRHGSNRRRSRRDYSDLDEYDVTSDPVSEEFVIDENTMGDTTIEKTHREEDDDEILQIVPRKRDLQLRKHDRPPLPMKNRSRSGTARSPGSGTGSQENSLERIQEILRSKDSSHHSTLRRSAHVKRNLELLQAADASALGDFGTISKITVIDSPTKQKGGNKHYDKKKDNKKGLLGFLRKK